MLIPLRSTKICHQEVGKRRAQLVPLGRERAAFLLLLPRFPGPRSAAAIPRVGQHCCAPWGWVGSDFQVGKFPKFVHI